MADDNRLNLSEDLDQLQADLLKDVKAATHEVKQRHAAIKAQEVTEASRAKSRKTQMLLVAIGAIVILLLSYWMVFARPQGQDQIATNNTGTAVTQPAKTSTVATPTTTPTTTPRYNGAGGAPAGRDSQVVEHPSDDYESPHGDQGM